jgi:thiosulfate/3-mercaptopyruvate sulfurtransferase
MARLPPLIDAKELAKESVRRSVVLVDARTGPDARARYEASHLDGAMHVDLDHDLAHPSEHPARGGRHPLPTPDEFAQVLGRLGIGERMRVVVYDDKGGANAAARFWWMMRAAGHDAVQVLDGGLAAALAAGIPADARPVRPTVRPAYKFDRWRWPLADAVEVAQAAGLPAQLVLDVRDPVRYRGESDPFDPTPGHIPGAVNVPFATNLGRDGKFLPPDALAEKYREVLGDRDPSRVIVSCGSGVTACHTLLAMESAGLEGAKLYVGSWSEWSRSGRPIATGATPFPGAPPPDHGPDGDRKE